MKKRKKKLVIIIFRNNTPSTPSDTAKEEAAMHFSLNVHNAGAGQTGSF
jgi:hypothetical protein